MTDQVFVSGLALHAYHGVMQHEAEVGQTFKLDLVLDLDLTQASRSDKLADTVGYDQVVDAASKAFCAKRYRLVEAAAGDRVEGGRRHPALVGAEMMLDAEAVVEAELVAELQLAPELLVALMRCHIGLAPDMGEVSEFHERSFHCGGEHRVAAEAYRGSPAPSPGRQFFDAGLIGARECVLDAHA